MDDSMNNKDIKTGSLLLSEPFMVDPNFKRTVVLIADYHKEEGTVGFILNKSMNIKLADLTDDFGDFDASVHYGGPVDNDSMYFIHNVGDLLEDSLKISRSVYWSGNYDKLKFLIENKLIKEDNIKFYIGYSGWTAGQLEDELSENSWMVSDMEPNFIFKNKPDQLWKEILAHKGQHFSAISDLEGDELMN